MGVRLEAAPDAGRLTGGLKSGLSGQNLDVWPPYTQHLTNGSRKIISILLIKTFIFI